MPNHVYNKIRISSDKYNLAELKKLLGDRENPLDFNKIVPESSECQESLAKPIANGEEQDLVWRSWRVDNWGTKWNSYDTYIQSEWDGGDCAEMQIHFTTAWSAPWPVIHALKNIEGIHVWGHYVEEFAESAGVF